MAWGLDVTGIGVGTGDEASSTGILTALAGQPFDRVALLAVAVTLGALAIWQALEAHLEGRRCSGMDRIKEVGRHLGMATTSAVIAAPATKLVLSAYNSVRNPQKHSSKT